MLLYFLIFYIYIITCHSIRTLTFLCVLNSETVPPKSKICVQETTQTLSYLNMRYYNKACDALYIRFHSNETSKNTVTKLISLCTLSCTNTCS